MGEPLSPPQSEPQKPSRSFEEIQNDLYAFKNTPDAQKERDLRIERARLINEAKEVGVFGSMKHRMLDIQTQNPSIIASAPIINEINATRFEEEAMGLYGWNSKFEGLLQAYKEGAIRNISLAYLRKSSAGQDSIDDLRRDIDLLNWGTPPALVESMPVEPALTDKPFAFSAHELAREMAEAQGLQTPEKYLQDALDTEEYLKTAFMIVPGQEPRFWPILTEPQKAEWQVRATLIIAAYKKQNADSTEKLYMGERKEMAVDLSKLAQQRIFRKPGVLATVGMYSTVIGDPKFLKYKDKTDISLKDVFCDQLTTDKVLVTSLKKDYGDKVFNDLLAKEDELYEGCADSFYPHHKSWGTTMDEKAFRETRKSVRHWLLTKGRDLLLSEYELVNRKEFFNSKFKSKEELFREMSHRAREAEQIAWNYVYISDLIENFDSRDYRPEGTGRLFPCSWWQLFQWVPMHPQQRFEAKIKRSDPQDKNNLIAKEDWSALGTWGVANISRGGFRDKKGKFRMPEELKVLPDTLIRSPLLPQKYEKGKDENKSLFAVFNSIGNDLLINDISTARNDELFNRIVWEGEDGMSDSPFVPYVYDEMRWADVVTNVFKKGGVKESRVSEKDLSEAVYNLKLTRKQREKLLIVYLDKADPNSSELKQSVGSWRWGDRVRLFLDDYPNYYLDAK